MEKSSGDFSFDLKVGPIRMERREGMGQDFPGQPPQPKRNFQLLGGRFLPVDGGLEFISRWGVMKILQIRTL
jgi:hypothetical protein